MKVCSALLAWLVVSLASSPVVMARDPAAEAKLVATAKGIFKSIRTETLPNGLRVYLLPLPDAPTVTTMMVYKVGAADEEKDQTGLSHYLEHLLFKGTDKLFPGDIDRLTQRNGGSNNAYTSEDMTAYHFDFASDRWMVALEIEADRMRNTRIDEKHEFEQEKGAVVAELKGGEDRPWELEAKAILPLLYPQASPYAHPVIGQETHVRGATAEIIKRYYDMWYHPNNAALIVVGGFDADAAMKRIRELFEPIPAGELPARKAFPPISKRQQAARKEFPSKFDVARMVIGFNGVTATDPDSHVLDVIEDILSRGKTSRLYRRLVEGDRLAGDVGAINYAGKYAGRYPSWFEVSAELLQGKDRAQVEAAAFEELGRLAKEPVSDEELARVKRGLLASFVFSQESVHGLADIIARNVTFADLDHLTGYLDRVLAVTPADVQRVAKQRLVRDQAVVVWSVPEAAAKTGAIPAPRPRMLARQPQSRTDKATGAAAFSLTQAQRHVLPNGLTLILFENHRLPIVVAAASIADVRLREPANKNGVMALLGEMLEEGTNKHTGQEIATLIEDTGGSLVVGATGGRVKVLTPDTELGLGLLFECLREPTFPAEALEQKREQLLATIAELQTQPQPRARQLFQASVYGSHPFGRPTSGTAEIVEKLTADDLRQFHGKSFGPDVATVVIAGDFDPKAMKDRIEALTAGWKPLKAAKPKPSAPPRTQTFTEAIVSDSTAAQTHVFIGHLGIPRNHPDYYKLLVLDNVLGTGPGFTDRLSATLRDRQGLAYTVRATITSSATDQPGTFLGYIGTFPDKYTWVRDGFIQEIRRIREEPATEQEVESAKKYLLGSMPFRVATLEQVAGELLDAERYGLGFDVLETSQRAVAAVTVADVQAMARKHLDPKKLTVVVVGPIGKDGKPLPEPKSSKKGDTR